MTARHLRSLATAAVLVLAALAAGTAHAAPPAGRPSPAPFIPTFAAGECPTAAPGLPPDLPASLPRRCGLVTVPLDHRAPARGTIELAAAILPATEPGPTAAAEPLLMLGGGPGEKMVTLVSLLASVPGTDWADLRRSRDLVLIDQRGVGGSRPALDCPEIATDLGVPPDERLVVLQEATAACHARLVGAGLDLGAFDTAANVRDLDLVRRALGFERWHVFGTSYGARLAWQATRLVPDRLASVVLASPVPAEENFLIDAPASFGAAVRGVVEACAADAACAAAYPDLATDVAGILERVRREPRRLPVVDPSSGRTVETVVDHGVLATGLFTVFYLRGGPAAVPYLVTEFARGNPAPLLSVMSLDLGSGFSAGMQMSFVCAEEAAYATRAELARNLRRGGPYGRAFWDGSAGPSLDRCDLWPVPPADRETFTPVRTAVPTLVVTGQFDQITPPAYGRTVHRQARGSHYVEVPGAGHSPLLALGRCGASLLAAFTADPQAPLDTGCVPAAPRFVTPADVAPPGGTPAPAPSPAPGTLIG